MIRAHEIKWSSIIQAKCVVPGLRIASSADAPSHFDPEEV